MSVPGRWNNMAYVDLLENRARDMIEVEGVPAPSGDTSYYFLIHMYAASAVAGGDTLGIMNFIVDKFLALVPTISDTYIVHHTVG